MYPEDAEKLKSNNSAGIYMWSFCLSPWTKLALFLPKVFKTLVRKSQQAASNLLVETKYSHPVLSETDILNHSVSSSPNLTATYFHNLFEKGNLKLISNFVRILNPTEYHFSFFYFFICLSVKEVNSRIQSLNTETIGVYKLVRARKSSQDYLSYIFISFIYAFLNLRLPCFFLKIIHCFSVSA